MQKNCEGFLDLCGCRETAHPPIVYGSSSGSPAGSAANAPAASPSRLPPLGVTTRRTPSPLIDRSSLLRAAAPPPSRKPLARPSLPETPLLPRAAFPSRTPLLPSSNRAPPPFRTVFPPRGQRRAESPPPHRPVASSLLRAAASTHPRTVWESSDLLPPPSPERIEHERRRLVQPGDRNSSPSPYPLRRSSALRPTPAVPAPPASGNRPQGPSGGADPESPRRPETRPGSLSISTAFWHNPLFCTATALSTLLLRRTMKAGDPPSKIQSFRRS